jgi:hypothetical protein
LERLKSVGGGIVATIAFVVIAIGTGFGGLVHWSSRGSVNQDQLTVWAHSALSNPSFAAQGSDLTKILRFMDNPGPATVGGFRQGCTDLSNVLANEPAAPPVAGVQHSWTAMEGAVSALSTDCSNFLAAPSTSDALNVVPAMSADMQGIRTGAIAFRSALTKSTSGSSNLQRVQSVFNDLGL